jgi:predicted RNA-binding Zn ribbon-like protein
MSDESGGPFFFTGDDPMSVASDLLNTIDLLADPADRLTSVQHLRAFLRGHRFPADPVTQDDLAAIRKLREQLRAVWQSGDLGTAVDRLNALLARHRPAMHLRVRATEAELAYGDRSAPIRGMTEEILGVLAQELARHGLSRLGTCDGDPCRCTFVDRSRNLTRRYCCDVCTSRAAAAAYRRRKRESRRQLR